MTCSMFVVVPGSQSRIPGEISAEPVDILELQLVVGGREVSLVRHFASGNQELVAGISERRSCV